MMFAALAGAGAAIFLVVGLALRERPLGPITFRLPMFLEWVGLRPVAPLGTIVIPIDWLWIIGIGLGLAAIVVVVTAFMAWSAALFMFAGYSVLGIERGYGVLEGLSFFGVISDDSAIAEFGARETPVHLALITLVGIPFWMDYKRRPPPQQPAPIPPPPASPPSHEGTPKSDA